MGNRRFRTAFLASRVAAAVEHQDVLAPFTFATVVDVGANRGQFALLAREIFPRSRIHSFEPLEAPAATFERVHATDPRVTLHRAALGASSGTATMHVSARDDSSSILPLTSVQTEMFRGTGAVGTEAVRVMTLVEALAPSDLVSPALLKIDVQGFELQVLEGCREVLDSFDHICAEGSFVEFYAGQVQAPELIAWLAQRGFELETQYNAIADAQGRTVQADMLFRRLASLAGQMG